ncbi:uncharacterized protein PFL1_00752 [Pseudozyma flocculosa PF-1]|uniref:Uncharacterized protein n=1 Tax=Pseudozyma flocculosa TaxID=84751 RepID=A0A5C3F393_9BASI|nr:uncharacterized protein PFL1_00752 [Pseudozyma flocculosa PF-1]EPQ31417.1 hypothetical protein PFL1_00752 [Pseudozyma flocculosa PF-1]SPO38802.1 uncharacterized protein PSFLO_04281 [Pseudozyma flocculosa]
MQLSSLLLSASLLATSAFGGPVGQDSTSEAELMVRGQRRNVDWPNMLLDRSLDERESEDLVKRIVWNPKITAPAGGENWTAGSEQLVSWSTADKPEELKDPKGRIMLGYEPADGAGGLNLKWTLADGFALNDGNKSVTLPSDLEARQDYIVVVFGDSGNTSPKFSSGPAPPTSGSAAPAPEGRSFFAADLIGIDVV